MLKLILFPIISFLILHNFFSSIVSSLDTLKPGETLNSSSYLISSRKIFTLRFYTLERTNKSYLSIWYANATGYPVWLANRDTPIYNNSGLLTISNTGKLMILHDGQVPIELYSSEGKVNFTATLLDTGNFVVKEGNKILWQSFDYPTDVLLPGMKLGINHRTGRNLTLTSWFSETNPAPGAFTLEWDSIRHRLIVRRRGIIYWTSGDLKFYNEYGFYGFEYIAPKPYTIDVNYVCKNVTNQDEEYFTYSLYNESITLENRKVRSGWHMHYLGNIFDFDRIDHVANAELCYGYNTRGNEAYLGCELWEQPKCREKHVQNFSFTYGYFEDNTASRSYDNNPNLSQSDCRANCWIDCICVAYIYEVTGGCLYWRGENAKFSQDSAASMSQRYFLRSYPSEKRPEKKWISIPVTIGFLLLSVGASLIVWRKYKQEQKKKMKELQELMTLEGYTDTYELENGGTRGLKMFSHASILSSTNNFSTNNKLGQGGFGPVYKGKMPEGNEIAIKLLSRSSGQGLMEFKTELLLISKLQHRNLVKLHGFCIHGDEKMIIYDYVPNKSLDFFLFDPEKSKQLNWETRFNIIEGIAQGLLYLHKHSRLIIVHRDLKASNILLDENMNPKISDFGLARIFKQNMTEANTNKPAGTYGYMAPEYVMHGKFSAKSDVYSFGVLILEIVSGRRNNSFMHLEGPQSLVDFTWELWELCTEVELMDPTLEGASNEDQVRRCIQVGLLCLQNHAIDRPPIEDVISMLKDGTSTLPMPKKPAFIMRKDVVQRLGNSKIEKLSLNEVSLSTVEGR